MTQINELDSDEMAMLQIVKNCGKGGLGVSLQTPFRKSCATALSRLEQYGLILDTMEFDYPCMILTDAGAARLQS